MGEERFIDRDKDKKYRIRVNENGEEELVILDDEEENAEDVPVFAVADEDEIDEEEKNAREEQARQARLEKAESLKSAAVAKMAEGDFESAQYALSQASELTEYDGELYFLSLKALSHGMQDFFDLEKCVNAAEGVRQYCTDEQRQELLNLSQPLTDRINVVESKCEQLKKESDSGKEERREVFLAARNRALIIFLCTLIPVVIITTLEIVFMSMSSGDSFYILLIVLCATATADIFAVSVMGIRLISAVRKVRLNENDSSTRAGRQYLTCANELENLKKIYSCISNDIS